MFTYTAMVHSLKSKAGLFKFPLLLSVVFLASCVGNVECKVDFADENIDDINCFNPFPDAKPVKYVLPKAGEVYTPATVAFEIEFPNGIPSGVAIRINGAEVQNDFVADGNFLKVPVVSSGASPLVWGALRDGANTFQVTNPVKGLYTFYLDFEDPRIHVLSVNDGWNGVTRKVCRGGWNAGNPPHTRCTGYNKNNAASTQEVNGYNVARVYYPYPKRGNVIVEGYVEGENYASVSSLRVGVSRIDSNGVKQALAVNGSNMYAIPGRRITNGTAVNGSTFELDFASAQFPARGHAPVISLGNMESGTCPSPAIPMGTGTLVGGNNYCYGATSNGWVASGAGLAASGSAFGPVVPEGTYVMFLQGNTSWASRTFTVPADGNYVFSFYAMQRGGNQQVLSLSFKEGAGAETEIAKIQATSSTPEGYSFRLNNLDAGTSYTLKFAGLNPYGGDNTMFLDYFSLTQGFDFYVNAHDTGNHDTNYVENEGDSIRFDVCKTVIGTNTYATNQCSSREWLRSNIPLSQARLNKGGGFSIAFDQVSFLSTGEGVMDLVTLVEMGDGTTNDGVTINGLMVMPPNAADEGIFLSLPNQPNNNTATLRVDAILDVRLDIHYSASWLSCNIRGTKTETHNSVNYNRVGRVVYRANVNLSVDGSGNTVVNITGDDMTLGSIDACGIGVGTLVDAAKGAILPIIRGSVGGVFANDLPTTRVKIGITTPLGSDLGPFYMPVQPMMARFNGSTKTGGVANPWDQKWVLDFGVHMRGVSPEYIPPANRPKRNVALGTTYSGNVLKPAVLNFKPGKNEARHGTSLGVSVTEDFVNQLFLGLWESGLLYIDFDVASPGMNNPFLTNVNFAFASTQPWQVDVIDTISASQPNFKITIPDLLINFTGDRYFPKPTSAQCTANGQASNCTYLKDYEFARMLGDVVIYSELTASPDGRSLRLRMTQALEIDVTEVSSDWDGTTEEQLAAALDQVFTFLTGGMVVDIPFPEILSSVTKITGVETDDDAIYLTIDVYSAKLYPKGPYVTMRDPYLMANSQLCHGGAWAQLQNGDLSEAGGGFHVCPTITTRTTNLGACSNNHVHSGSYLSGNTDHCHRYDNTSWSSNAYEWGFGFYTLKANTITQVALDARNNACCDTRANNIMLRLYEGNTLKGTYGPFAGTGFGERVLDIPNVVANRLEFYVPINTGDAYYAKPPRYRVEPTPAGWIDGVSGDAGNIVAEATFQAVNGIGRTGGGERIINFAEVVIRIAD